MAFLLHKLEANHETKVSVATLDILKHLINSCGRLTDRCTQSCYPLWWMNPSPPSSSVSILHLRSQSLYFPLSTCDEVSVCVITFFILVKDAELADMKALIVSGLKVILQETSLKVMTSLVLSMCT